MSDVFPNAISPLLPDFFFAGALAGWAGLTPLVGSRFGAARDGFEPSEFLGVGEEENAAWPYILFGPSEDAEFDFYAQTATLLDAPFLVRAFMREDIALLRGQDFEDATSAICLELQKALTGFGAREIAPSGAVLGTVHGCELLPGLHRAVYGERGRRVSEMGVYARILCN